MTEGGGRLVGCGRERIEARRKNVRLTARRTKARVRRSPIWREEREERKRRPSWSNRVDIVIASCRIEMRQRQ